jgi:hypothetical protein
VRNSYDYAHPAYEYQRAPYQYYNVSYAPNLLFIDSFRPELGRMDSGALAHRITTNLSRMPVAVGEAVSAKNEFWRRSLQQAQHNLLGHVVIPPHAVSVPIFGFAVLVIAGLVSLVFGGDWLMIFIILGSVGLTCTTPWPAQFARYLSPLAPFLIIAAVLALSGIDALLRAAERRVVTTLGQVTLASVLVLAIIVQAHAALWLFGERARANGATFVPAGSRTGAHFFYHDRSWRAWEEATAWIDAHAPADAVVATDAPHLCYLRTGRRAVLPPMESHPVRARRLLDAVPVSYVIVDELRFLDVSRRYALPAVHGDGTRWFLVYSVNGTQVYQHITGPQ